MSGTSTGLIESMANIVLIKPSDLLYNVLEVKDKRVGDYISFYAPSVEITIEEVN